MVPWVRENPLATSRSSSRLSPCVFLFGLFFALDSQVSTVLSLTPYSLLSNPGCHGAFKGLLTFRPLSVPVSSTLAKREANIDDQTNYVISILRWNRRVKR